MNNNDILRRLRYALELSDREVAKIIKLTERDASGQDVVKWMKPENAAGFTPLSHDDLIAFLDGLIIERRGPGPKAPKSPSFLFTNEVLKKLRIALQLRDVDILEIFKKVEFDVSKAELGSYFRRPEHRNFRQCPEQVLRKFIAGLCVKEGGTSEFPPEA